MTKDQDPTPHVKAFLEDAARLSEARRRAAPGQALGKGWTERLIDEFLSLNSREAADAALKEAGARPLDSRFIQQTGLGHLLAVNDVDEAAVARQVVEHLMSALGEEWEFLVTDIDQRSAPPAGTRISGWEIWHPNDTDLRQLAPVPAAAQHSWRFPIDLDAETQVAWLRRSLGTVPRPSPTAFRFSFGSFPQLEHWRPLLVLNLFSDAPVKAPVAYDAVSRHAIYKFGRELLGEWREEDDFQVYASSFDSGRGVASAEFSTFAAAFDDRLNAATSGKGGKKHLSRYERAARQFLMANDESWPDASADVDREADIALRYVIAMETLLSPGQQGELTRTVAQRAAVLAGSDDEDRMTFESTVRRAYNFRSRYVHGDEPPEVNLRQVREAARRVLLRWITTMAAAARRGDRPGELIDQIDHALLSSAVLRRSVTEPVTAFGEELRGGVG